MSECRMNLTMGCATMSAEFPNRPEAMTVLICWVESEAETLLQGDAEERYAAARKWIEQQGGVVEIAEDAP